jgi:hypothetical protein
MPLPAIAAGLAVAGRVLFALAKNPAVRRVAVKAAQKAGQVFNSSKKQAVQLCEKVVRKLQGKKTVEQLIKKATGPPKVDKNLIQYPMKGGYKQAAKDFNSLIKGKAKDYPNGTRVGKLPDGQTKINVRPQSTAKKPTVEVQPPKGKTVKFRYD